MEKTVRCTVCPWRGPWVVAESAPRIRASQIPPGEEQIQDVLEEAQAESISFGAEHPPSCPACGHHTVPVKMHGYRAAV
jgi:hypothetical protein